MFEKDEKTLVKAIGIILVFVLGGLASTFFVTAIKPISGNSQFSRTIITYNDTVCANDTEKYLDYFQRLDSLNDVVSNVRDQYQTDISIGIDRLNGWVGFWLAILTLVLLLAGIWQYLQVRRHEQEWEDIKEKNEELTSELEEKKNKLEDKLNQIEQHWLNIQQQVDNVQGKIKLENTMFNLLRTMSAFNDPMMLLTDDKRKPIILNYLRKSRMLLHRYLETFTNDAISDDESFVIGLMLTNYHINICRCQMLFDTPRASLKVQEFLTKVDFLAQSLRSGKSIKREELDDFINELCELIALVE